eukprot:11197419-Lingulodinium_polyedra.AAC.1
MPAMSVIALSHLIISFSTLWQEYVAAVGVGAAHGSIARVGWLTPLRCLNKDRSRPVVSRAGWTAIRSASATVGLTSSGIRVRSLTGADRVTRPGRLSQDRIHPMWVSGRVNIPAVASLRSRVQHNNLPPDIAAVLGFLVVTR